MGNITRNWVVVNPELGNFLKTSEIIVFHRERVGLTRPALAGQSGIPLRSLEKIEQGVVAEPKLADIAKIAAALGMTCADFVANDLPSPPPPPVGRPTKPEAPPAKVKPPAKPGKKSRRK